MRWRLLAIMTIIESEKIVYEGSIYYLRITIDKNSIVTLDDCVFITNLINPILDKADLIEDSYVLDVCSKEKGCE